MEKFARFCLVIAMAAGLGGTLVPSASATGSVQIYKIYFNSPGTDTRSNTSLNAEYVVIKNKGTSNRSLTSWTLRDAAGHVYKFGSFTLRAGYSVTVHTGKGTNTSTHRYWGSANYIWNNTGDTAYLKNSSGTTQDYCRYSGSGSYVYC
jgi:lamin tail-like protein